MIELSNISEGIWGNISKRADGTLDRKEDIAVREFIDFGDDCTVYWAKDALEIDGKNLFYFEDVQDYNDREWRLPTVEEVKQVGLNYIVSRSWYRDDDGIGYIWIQYPNGTLRIKTEDGMASSINMWTKDRNNIFNNQAYYYNYKFETYSGAIKISRLYVFLVKDKKK